MIDPGLFTVGELLKVLLKANSIGCASHEWRTRATIIPDYMPPHPSSRDRPTCIVELDGSYLRYSKGPQQGHFWDVYGDDYLTPAIALAALLEAPPPPWMIKSGRKS